MNLMGSAAKPVSYTHLDVYKRQALASLPILTEAHLALAQRPQFADPNKGIHIDANENPLGPSEAARQAIANIIPRGGRYLFDIQEDLAATFAGIEGLNPESVMPLSLIHI